MTTTACDDQFSAEPEPVHQPYDVAAILRKNIADLEKELQRQREQNAAATERLREQIERVTSEWERAENDVAAARSDLQSFIDSRNEWKQRAEAAEKALKEAQEHEQEPVAFWWIGPDGKDNGGPYRGKPSDAAIDNALNMGCEPVLLYARPVPAAPAVAVPAVPEEWREVVNAMVEWWDDQHMTMAQGREIRNKARALLQSRAVKDSLTTQADCRACAILPCSCK